LTPTVATWVQLVSGRMSKITNDGLTRSGTECFIAVPIQQQWASMRPLSSAGAPTTPAVDAVWRKSQSCNIEREPISKRIVGQGVVRKKLAGRWTAVVPKTALNVSHDMIQYESLT